MVILLSEKYSSFKDKVLDNMDFTIWVSLFSLFLLGFGVGLGFLFNWFLGGTVLLFGLFYFLYLFMKLSYVTEKISVTEFGIHSERILLRSRFKGNHNEFKKSDDFYVVFSDIVSFKFRGNDLMLKNKNTSVYDDLNYRFSNLSDENVVKIREILLQHNILEIDNN